MAEFDRRQLLAGGLAAGGAMSAMTGTAAARTMRPPPAAAPARRIAVEEAWTIAEHQDALAALATGTWPNLDAQLINPLGSRGPDRLTRRLRDVTERLAEMDRLGVDMQILSLTSPGVQMFRADQAVAMAELANDRLAEVVRAHPKRFAGLASFAPQDPGRAAKEMERAVNKLGFSGFIVNSHTNNEYLDDPKFMPILEAAAALDRPIYIHPRCPSDGMAEPFRDHRLQSAIWGYAAETGTHAMRLILSGVFDKLPNLKIVIGHMGENIPFHLWRTDHWFERRRDAYGSKLKPSEVMKRNVYITTSGVEHGPALRYAIDVLGVDRVLWAIDYPYEEMEPSVTFINHAPLDGEEREAVCHRNAAQVFHLPPA
ncbi:MULTISPECIES: amidohydrolase family protein [unclassified Sphingobium]|uniref:amidohydrolase family protein n=1 Tax=unclassified Sphingobium TaxID=2611147 RepID=UPI00222442E4|nr:MULTISPECIES: amidohydrolase family protein [unclassified Sphingobium]MCW2351094.1 putative TIM-barrel fold metal-dependent hydrolase [Sphingobium sp. B12D2B]MCW2370310.1 putative TIM-barrel fold metal-dependent hydrolase [Sphingobium sp. B11D3D]MCW2395288.1 putative TIM-barrel fold metal-dependent hydrolase [Sphingobium sp. B8D3B]MCW2418802.1 putative TIM-barrel fold metal-dependent hydrolase [Sphingobium sp. B8D3C]